MDASFSIESAPDDFICHNELIKLFLKVIVLQCEQISVVLQGMELLFVAVSGLEERFVTLSDRFQLARQGLQLVVILYIGAFGAVEICI